MDLRKGHGSLTDCLVFVAEQHEPGAGIVSSQYHELGGRIVLYLIDHDIFGAQITLAGEEHLEIEPFKIGQLLSA